jgi:hypothetical protein
MVALFGGFAFACLSSVRSFSKLTCRLHWLEAIEAWHMGGLFYVNFITLPDGKDFV